MDGLTKSILLWRDYRSISSSDPNVMTVQFDIAETPNYGVYLNGADGMPYGKTEEAISAWQEFFGYKPCLFKNGRVVGYLNPNDYTKFENGTSADITSGNAGDVMVEFPRRGIQISKSGTTVTVSMTKDPDNPDFTYYAHTRGTTKKDYFYMGAYLSSSSVYPCSVPNRKNPGTSKISYARSQVKSKYSDNNYSLVGYYQHVFIQCMYLLQFKGNLNSRNTAGKSFTTGSNYKSIGRNTTRLFYYGYDGLVIFGIEDYWGNGPGWNVDGIYRDSNGNILIGTDNFNDKGRGYTNYGQLMGSGYTGGYIFNTSCTSETGFIPTELSDPGSAISYMNKYFCAVSWNNFTSASFEVGDNDDHGSMFTECFSGGGTNIGIRIMYL